MANSLIVCSNACLTSDFTIKDWGKNKDQKSKDIKTEGLKLVKN
jgi:hypothetical protein